MTPARRVGWFLPFFLGAVLPLQTVTSRALAQDKNPEGWERYMTFDETRCEVGEKTGGKQVIHLQFDVVEEVPLGTRIHISLENLGIEVVGREYELKGTERKDLTLEWTPEKLLAPGDYYIRTRIYLDPKKCKQAPAVRAAIKAQPQRFPPKFEPWAYYYMNDENVIRVPDTLDPEVVQKALQEVYGKFMDGLVDNMIKFVDTMKEVREGSKFVKSGRLDVEDFTKYVTSWQKKQGELQKEIRDFPMEERALFQKSQAAWFLVSDLGRMVSKRSVLIQDAITKKYGLANPIRPESSRDFDKSYALKDVGVDALQQKLGQIEALIFPPEEEEPPPPEEAPPETPETPEKAAEKTG